MTVPAPTVRTVNCPANEKGGGTDRRACNQPRTSARNVIDLCPPIKVPLPSNGIQEDKGRSVVKQPRAN